MTTPVRYFPTGPIKTGDNIILAITIKTSVYVAIYDKNTIVFHPLYISGKLNPVINLSSVLVFNIDMSGTRMVVKRPSNVLGNFLSIDENNILTVNQTQSRFILKSKYSDPPNGYVAFSCVDYNFTTRDIAPLIYYNTGTKTQTINNKIFIISSSYFLHDNDDVSTTICQSIVDDPIQAAEIFSNSINGIKQHAAWTRIRDCTRSVNYNYCLKNQTCGECLGPCKTAESQCIYNSHNSSNYAKGNIDTFVCSDRAISIDKSNIPDTPFYKSGFIVLVIIILVIISICIAIYTMTRRRYFDHYSLSREKPAYKIK